MQTIKSKIIKKLNEEMITMNKQKYCKFGNAVSSIVNGELFKYWVKSKNTYKDKSIWFFQNISSLSSSSSSSSSSSLILILIFGFNLSSCSFYDSLGTTTHHISVSSITESNLNTNDKAEALAKTAEEILDASGFEEANKVANMALQENPKNIKAGFIKAYTDFVLVFKGIGVRLEPLYNNDPETLSQYKKELAIALQDPSNNFYEKLIMDGDPDIKTEENLLQWIDKLINAFDELRMFAKSNKDSELTIKAYPLFAKILNDRYAKSCELKVNKEYEYEITCPSNNNRFELSLNRADFEEIQFTSTYMMVYLAFINSYDLTGAMSAASIKNKNSNFGAQEIYEELFKNQDFGKLRSQSNLHLVKTLGMDVLVSLEWYMNNPKLSCPNGEETARNRPGMLMNQGRCISPYFNSIIKMGTDFFNGQSSDEKVKKDGNDYTIKRNYMNFINNPSQNLRLLGPVQFDKCDQLISVGDSFLNGIYPNGDVNVVLPLINSNCTKK